MPTFKLMPFYLGKCIAWGDFMQSKAMHGLIQRLDQWIDPALTQAMQSHNFSEAYTQWGEMQIYISHPQSSLYLMANIRASHDHGGRPYPMLMGYLVQAHQFYQYLNYAPYMYRHLSELLQKYNISLCSTQQTSTVQKILDDFLHHKFFQNIDDQDDYFKRCFDQLSWSDLAGIFDLEISQLSQSLIAFGIVLKQRQLQCAEYIDRVMILPLGNRLKILTENKLDEIYKDIFTNQAQDWAYQSQQDQHYICACFWLALIADRITQQKSEIMYAIWQRPETALIIALQGADIDILSDLFCGDLNQQRWLSLIQAEWVDDYIEQNAGLAVFEQNLNRGELSVNQVIAQFKLSFSIN